MKDAWFIWLRVTDALSNVLVDQFRDRWNNYNDKPRKFERGKHLMGRHLYENFILPVTHGF